MIVFCDFVLWQLKLAEANNQLAELTQGEAMSPKVKNQLDAEKQARRDTEQQLAELEKQFAMQVPCAFCFLLALKRYIYAAFGIRRSTSVLYFCWYCWFCRS